MVKTWLEALGGHLPVLPICGPAHYRLHTCLSGRPKAIYVMCFDKENYKRYSLKLGSYRTTTKMAAWLRAHFGMDLSAGTNVIDMMMFC